MTPVEARKAFQDFQKSVGQEAHVSLFMNVDYFYREKAIGVFLYPLGMTHKRGHVRADGDTFEEALDAIKAVWADAGDRYRAERIRKMALAIIRITAEQGACTDAALRADEFTDDEVGRYSEDAVADANAIASNGPFSIQRIAGANAA